ncbi:MAG: tRNA (5-methylaminomethyl-2-thiouridine)(34)-methyltransferase MnmD [Desulforegulaceae bacterium]|jgi:tRNA 5-methylaminomethyl-2-thiouridine biosynthesis bifunctional protein|nr:tRNA (5-methylaminomethyl-2-thiouridine)(34)-methyltransferase MnmD [Desulforegulaceae bacterium]
MHKNFAKIEILETGDIYSPVFNDIYFSPAGGYMESLHVFAEPNNIPQKFCFKNITNIFEAGFGTGLNFLLTLKLFLQFAPKSACLNYTSFEKYPISPEHMEEIHKFFIYLRYESLNFLKAYSKIDFNKNFTQISFFNKRVNLKIIFDDLAEIKKYLSDKYFDAWYLDGFNPKENPEMWNEGFFEFMGKNSLDNATFSTFSAAGFIKRGLLKNGFQVEKIKGFNRKREMLKGYKTKNLD